MGSYPFQTPLHNAARSVPPYTPPPVWVLTRVSRRALFSINKGQHGDKRWYLNAPQGKLSKKRNPMNSLSTVNPPTLAEKNSTKLISRQNDQTSGRCVDRSNERVFKTEPRNQKPAVEGSERSFFARLYLYVSPSKWFPSRKAD